jgi:hypothetical protein
MEVSGQIHALTFLRLSWPQIRSERSEKLAHVLHLTPHHKDVWESGDIATRFLNLGARLRDWPALRLCCFITGERPHGTHWLEKAGWVPQLLWTQCTRSKSPPGI